MPRAISASSPGSCVRRRFAARVVARGASKGASSSIISSAASIDSPPLFMRVTSARSSACAWFSVVSTPKITGTPVASPASMRPRAHSPAT